MWKIRAYRAAYGGTYEDAYIELIDMGELRENEHLRARARALDRVNYPRPVRI